jgi:hypothetical protein
MTAWAPSEPWQLKMLDGRFVVQAMQVEDKMLLPRTQGIPSCAVIEDTRVVVPTPEGGVEVQNGDWLIQFRPDADADMQAELGLAVGEVLRLSCDEARARLTP